MIENYKEVIKPEMTIKNYKIMCDLLNENIMAGNSRDAQLKEWSRYFSHVKQGHKYIITEVYSIPKDKEDNRSQGNGTTHGLSKTKIYQD